MADLNIRNLRKNYSSFRAVDDVSLTAGASELVALLGPSGCGKTTLLRSIAGFVPVTSGRIEINGTDVTRLAPNKRNTGMVFQNYALFPHLTVEKNVGFGLEMRGITGAEAGKRINEALELVSLGALGHRYPKELSGGQQQRVAVARALVVNPDVFLLDEPLSNLDAKLRQSVGMQLRDLQKSRGLTTVFVTHDQKEALMMADRLVIMRAGKVVQEGSAEELYAAPASYFVADFLGHSNVLTGTVVPEGFVTRGGQLFRCDNAGLPDDHVMTLRPENLILGPEAEGLGNRFDVRVRAITYLGALSEVEVELPGGERLTATRQNRTGDSLGLTVGDTLPAGCRPEAVRLLVDDMTTAH